MFSLGVLAGLANLESKIFKLIMSVAKILWVDDEIESLQSQKIFLENKGYNVHTLTNGFDAIDYVKENFVDVVLLDETMPGLTGLETLAKIKEVNTQIPVVLITKNETENLMDEAIGSQITDYLIKPVNPNQVWLSLKKIIDNRRLVAEKTTTAYQQQFRNLFMVLNSNPNFNEWMGIYKELVHWELSLQKSDSPEMQEVFQTQKNEANTEFFKFISRNYASWIKEKGGDKPVMSHTLMKEKVIPNIEKGIPTFFVLIDNLRFDQWRAIQPLFTESFRIVEEDSFYSILPTATHYARNAIFAGMMPTDIEKKFPHLWKNDEDEGVSEGVIGYDRILKMLVVHNGELMIEEKAIYSVEKFLVARRLMYWQVYLHKTVVVAEKMLVKIIERAKELLANGIDVPVASPTLNFFLKDHQPDGNFIRHLEKFSQLDDTDVMCTIKHWCNHFDTVLSRLSHQQFEYVQPGQPGRQS